MSTIDEVKQRTDIVEVISQYTTLTKAGRTFRALCPFHSEKHPSFFVYPEQQSWHCFGACNTGGDIFSFVMKKQDIDFGEALRLLAQRAGVIIPSKFEPDAKKDERERLYQANEAAAQYFHNLLINSQAGEKVRNYLTNRSISPKTITDFQLGYSLDNWEALKQYLLERGYIENELLEAGLILASEDGKTHDRFRNRLMFPIIDSRGHTIGFGARVLDDLLPKYINSPQTPIFDKSNNLYGINLAAPAIRQQNLAVIVEGYMDVITAHQNGFTNVVAAMGTSVTEKQVSALKRLTKNMTLALDADAAGEEATLRSIDYENTLDIEVKFAILPKGKDPDDIIRDDTQAWQDMVYNALLVVDYTFTRDESLAIDRLLPIIARIKDDLRRDRYVTKLAKLSGHAYDKLESAIQKYLARQKVKEPNQESVTHTPQPLLSSPLEEYCLALLLQHPELKNRDESLLPEYFENSENREIFIAWQQADDLPSLKDKLDTAIWEHLDTLINKTILATQIEERYNKYVLRLNEEHLRGLERKREAVFTLEAESGGTGADLAKLEEEGIETAIQLGKVFTQKARRGHEQRR
ncbi:DNA primase [Chloroflexota bacterium]